MHCCVRKGGEEESKAKRCITDRVALGVSVMGTRSGYGGTALTVFRSYCHRSISHFNEVQ